MSKTLKEVNVIMAGLQRIEDGGCLSWVQTISIKLTPEELARVEAHGSYIEERSQEKWLVVGLRAVDDIDYKIGGICNLLYYSDKYFREEEGRVRFLPGVRDSQESFWESSRGTKKWISAGLSPVFGYIQTPYQLFVGE